MCKWLYDVKLIICGPFSSFLMVANSCLRYRNMPTFRPVQRMVNLVSSIRKGNTSPKDLPSTPLLLSYYPKHCHMATDSWGEWKNHSKDKRVLGIFAALDKSIYKKIPTCIEHSPLQVEFHQNQQSSLIYHPSTHMRQESCLTAFLQSLYSPF